MSIDGHSALLSTLPATDAQRRRALVVVALSGVIFVALAPFAKVQLPQVWAFIPIYQSVLVVNDLITAALLFGQFRMLRSSGLLVLASGYLFTGFMAVAHGLSFPGLFAPTGLLGAGPQSTAWLYMFWHGGFSLLVMVYALRKNEAHAARPSSNRARFAILSAAAAVLLVVCGLTWLATAAQDALPSIMRGSHYTPAMLFVVSSVWALNLGALVALWRRRPHSVLDLWLIVVLCAWVFDIGLSAVLNAGRFDVGFYAGRIYGLLAATLVLILLLLENSVLYARLVESRQSELLGLERLQQQSTDLITANNELESFSYSVSHDLRAPLRAIDGFALMLEEDCAARLDEEGKRFLSVIRTNSQKMGMLIDDLLALSRVGRQGLSTGNVAMESLAQEVIHEALDACARPSAQIELASLPAVQGDHSLLRQVWMNLISNALKYTSRARQPRIEVSGYREGTEVVYRVRDNGAGFDMRYYDKLFGVFQRLHRDDEFSGTGVGLAIVQRIVKRHRGRVWAEGKPGEGAAFYFALPAAFGHD